MSARSNQCNPPLRYRGYKWGAPGRRSLGAAATNTGGYGASGVGYVARLTWLWTLLSQITPLGLRALAGSAATAMHTAFTIDPAGLPALRNWLTTRLNYRVG